MRIRRILSGGLAACTVASLAAVAGPAASASPPVQTGRGEQTTVSYPTGFAVSPPLRSMKPRPAPQGPQRTLPVHPLPHRATFAPDAALQTTQTATTTPSPGNGATWEGVGNIDGVAPPDTNGDVGPTDYVQWVNLHYAVYDKATGNQILGPLAGDQIWSALGNSSDGCSSTNNGDPIALYDRFSDRWLLSQFSFPNGSNSGPYYQCIAVSTTGDPTGTFTLYAYQVSSNLMNDYPKFGVWPDGYYMTVNDFKNGSSFSGAGVFAFDRLKMVAGVQSVPMITAGSNPISGGTTYGGLLPASVDGFTSPPSNSPEYFVAIDDTASGTADDTLRIWKWHPDFATPGVGTFSGPVNVPITGFSAALTGIPQPAKRKTLDPLNDRAMYRLAYRNFGDHEALVVNHSVDVTSTQEGIRWIEIRDPGGSPSVYQQSTYAGSPADTVSRWMGSVAMDHVGDMALGYSKSSSSVYPTISYT